MGGMGVESRHKGARQRQEGKALALARARRAIPKRQGGLPTHELQTRDARQEAFLTYMSMDERRVCEDAAH